MTIQLLYFARLREVLGCESEYLDASATPWDVAGLLAHLRSRGGAWAVELAVDKVFRVAVNQELANQGTPIPSGAEVAIFPPVTGG
ncbi:MoaD/ThiS family protein [Chitinimonas viridis]|uniref:Molybdopterin synthase sulfur carrier subunit n=1 Tax=Chitinimonas viridis TaxID=664880 RepID=A0ABT8B4E2_9NEIS|nr:MoaD/ThiS family protein [Chitinimonas viridis]MDN3576418.1 MoaD/ThiS family protein [Chitinimonas viridis]